MSDHFSDDPDDTGVLAFEPAVRHPSAPDSPSLWFAFRGGRLLVRQDEEATELAAWDHLAGLGAAREAAHYLGRLGQAHCFALDLHLEEDPPAGLAFESLRLLYGRLPEHLFSLAGRAVQIVEWDRTHRYCGRCGQPTVNAEAERAKVCPHCGLLSFPRLSPAVIMLVQRDDEILLARGRRFAGSFYSVLAGFVEPGESLEEAVAREVREETAVEVRDLRYFGSQPWPFPHSLMVGFTCTYAGGELRVDETELVEAGWFTRDNLPQLPSRMSIARKLVDAWLDGAIDPS